MYPISAIRASRQGGAHGSSTPPREARLVLLVEDNPDIQSMMAAHLVSVGFDVCLASDGEEAMQMVRERHPGVVCLDLNLPRISGYDVCEQIRADPAIEDISILMTSARRSLDVRVFSLEAGADAYLTKPFGMDQLTVEIERLFELRAQNLANDAPQSQTQSQTQKSGAPASANASGGNRSRDR